MRRKNKQKQTTIFGLARLLKNELSWTFTSVYEAPARIILDKTDMFPFLIALRQALITSAFGFPTKIRVTNHYR